MVTPSSLKFAAIACVGLTTLIYVGLTLVIHSQVLLHSVTPASDGPIVSLQNYLRKERVMKDKPRKFNNELKTVNPNRKHAYVFLMAGCDSTKPGSFMGYVYNILVAAYILRLSGSNRDIMVMVRMASSTQETNLPPDLENIFQNNNILLKYLPKVKVDNFYTATMDKFEILNLVQYNRVLFLDSDIMPFCNLDYLFDLSEGTSARLQENVVLAGKNEPANAGLFMLKPNHGDYVTIQSIQHDRMMEARDFDIVKGWGHTITAPDQWSSKWYKKNGTKWDFYLAFGDQGLLYHWVKYVKKRVSIAISEQVETWIESKGEVKMAKLEPRKSIFGGGCKASLPIYQLNFPVDRDIAPYNDFEHFTGYAKPWVRKPPPAETNTNSTVFVSKTDFWYHILRNVAKQSNLNVSIDSGLNITLKHQLGFYSTFSDVERLRAAHLEEKKLN